MSTAILPLRHASARPGWSASSILVLLAALLGGGILAYPAASDWFSDVAHAHVIESYGALSNELPPSERGDRIAAAREYNANLPNGPLRDPYTLNARGEAVSLDEGRPEYLAQLNTGDDGLMARLQIPAIDVDLPIYHGTSTRTLDRGVGHFYGSALPVGGQSTHAVLTAHSGMVEATLFDNLDEVGIGDVFSISVFGEQLFYEVDNIATVLPNESDALRQVDGRDFVTLVTCTPTGVNTHRLLVRGSRIDAPPATSDGSAFATAVPDPGPPWWLLIVVVPVLVTGALVRPQPERNSR